MTSIEFIDNILETRGRFACEGYYERHHIIPRCLGGTDDEDNLIDLYAREHFEIHKLLAKENPTSLKLVSAWHMMAFPKGDIKRNFEITAEDYEELRRMRGEVQREYRLKVGWPKSDSAREKYRLNKLGDKNPMKQLTGENHPNYDKKLYNNGVIQRYYVPGEQPNTFIEGGLHQIRKNARKIEITYINDHFVFYSITLAWQWLDDNFSFFNHKDKKKYLRLIHMLLGDWPEYRYKAINNELELSKLSVRYID